MQRRTHVTWTEKDDAPIIDFLKRTNGKTVQKKDAKVLFDLMDGSHTIYAIQARSVRLRKALGFPQKRIIRKEPVAASSLSIRESMHILIDAMLDALIRIEGGVKK